ncbi:glycosyltransferase family 4 protein [Streptomyces hoynatensis]|uniref:D-inositol 3-phosphate glycosyltransferase n=1 Tax=Streptomyces hoynatensis TaxID=1141874 RepID=A0A3A9ZFQ2_9ACTN|nr:glycosyltransferase family 4 protein [Streptomyces hoynatensis]RKN47168.1 glycosyltransferase family 4 protein [Streptomyces hoynatensis]
MKIVFLLNNAYGIGGTIRSVGNLSAALAARGHEVRVASLYRHRDVPSLGFHPDVTVEPLIDLREGVALPPAGARPSELFAQARMDFGSTPPSLLSDRLVAEYLAGTDAEVVISTRPTLNAYLARFGDPRRHLRIGQEHLTLRARKQPVRALQLPAAAVLDAFVPVSEADAAAYRDALPAAATRVLCIPNCSPTPAVAPATGDSTTIVAAGRLVPVKRYDRLIDAFAKVAPEFPEWDLRIYGRGPVKDALRRRIEEHGLYDRARLMGAASPIEAEWVKGAIAAVSSDVESFGLTLVEAMACGVPVVSTDCPHGPREILTEGEDGLLTPLDGGSEAFADALRRLMADPALRRRMGAAGLRSAARYRPETIARRYEELFAALLADRPRPRSGPRGEGRGRPGAGGLAGLRGLRGLRRLVGGGRPRGTRQAPPAQRPRPAARPLARVACTADGGLTVSALPPAGELRLRLRQDPRGREVRVPVGKDGTATLSRASLTLEEGRWDVFAGAKPKRVGARLVERAALVGTPPTVDERGVSAWIPYVTAHGNLSLRTWLRPAHAEVADVVVGSEEVRITAALLTTEPPAPERVRAVAAPRGQTDGEIGLAVRPLAAPGLFSLVLRQADVPDEGRWDLRLCLPDGALVPLGRIGGDIPDRKKIDVLPSPGPRLRLYFSTSNDLALSRAAKEAAGAEGEDGA